VQVTCRKTCEDCDGTGIIENVDANDAERMHAHTFLSQCGAQVSSQRHGKQIMVQVSRGIHSGNILW
jgi:hypothetical protein